MKPQRNGQGEAQRAGRPAGSNDYVELWINLARREWHSLVVVPADRDGSTAEVASTLADIGQRLSFGAVTAITIHSLEFGSALALADLQQHVERERRARAKAIAEESLRAAAGGPAAPTPVAPPDSAGAEPPAAAGPATGAPEPKDEALAVVPPARLIISVPPVITEPLGLTAAGEADAIVLSVHMNRSRMVDVRRTIQLIGRERITGCFVVR